MEKNKHKGKLNCFPVKWNLKWLVVTLSLSDRLY